MAITRGRDTLIPDRMKKNGASSCPPTRSSSTRSSTSSAITTTAREGRRPLRRREVPGPGPGPIPAGTADDARGPRATHPRLPPPRRDQLVRRVQHRRQHRHRHCTAATAPSSSASRASTSTSPRPAPPGSIERWFGLLTDKLLRRGVHTSVQALEGDIRAWIDTWNTNPRPFTWTKTADEIPPPSPTTCTRSRGRPQNEVLISP